MKRGRSAPRDESSDEDIGPSLPPSAKPIAPAPSLIAVPLLRGVTEAQLQVAQEALPNSLYYERSYMHRDIVTHVVVTPATDFLLTASADGCIKFWRKGAEGIVFVKAYRAHLGEICAVAASHDGVRLATCGDDGTLKLFDVATFDMVTFSKLNFLPSCASWCYPPGSPTHTLALGDRHSPIIRLFDGDTGILFAQHSSLTLHTAPVCAMSYAPSIDTCLSGDAKGILECWSGDRDRGFTPPAGILNYDSKLDTDLYDLVKIKATPDAISWHPRGIFFLVASSDRVLRLFSTGSGKCLAKYGYSAEACTLEGLALFGEEEWRRRVAVEADVESAAIWSRQKLLAAPLPEGPVAPSPNDSSPPSSNSSYSAAINPQSSPTPLFTSRTPRTVGWFDYSGHFVLFTTPLGVKVVCIDTQKTCAILGARERERFVGGAMFQGISSGIGAAAAGGTGGDSSATSSGGVVTGGNSLSPDPMVFLCAYGRPRFYCLSSRDPPGAPKVLPGQLKGVITTRKGEESGQEDRQEEEEEEEDGRGPHHSRDSMNEPPNRLDSASAALVKRAAAATAGKHSGESMTSLQGGGGGRLPGGRPNLGAQPGSTICLSTDRGEIWLQLFPGDAPKACENFSGLCKRGSYDRCQFFRCIKGFMVQTGDPDNSGMGGKSIWGKEFEDEIVPGRRFNVPGVLAMANAGPATNGSQFFITTAACPHLDGKHTIFGRVLSGFDVVEQIAALKTDRNDRPLGDIPRIVSTRSV